MSIQDIGAIGELLAAIATLITLIYLATQIRQNTRGMQMGQSQEFIRWNTELVEPLVTERDLAELWQNGQDNLSDLDSTDQLRITLFEWRAIGAWHHYYHMRQLGLIPDHLWIQLVGLFKRIGQREAMQQAWLEWRDVYDEEFQDFMDQYLSQTSNADA